mmetsp:Transcript_26731/g.67610  ORF Transcript_26731/g.67610 Transcript_26731/m.67610 type:complete len:209 (+) Transcript_26731:237-863(+)
MTIRMQIIQLNRTQKRCCARRGKRPCCPPRHHSHSRRPRRQPRRNPRETLQRRSTPGLPQGAHEDRGHQRRSCHRPSNPKPRTSRLPPSKVDCQCSHRCNSKDCLAVLLELGRAPARQRSAPPLHPHSHRRCRRTTCRCSHRVRRPVEARSRRHAGCRSQLPRDPRSTTADRSAPPAEGPQGRVLQRLLSIAASLHRHRSQTAAPPAA